MCVCVCVSHFLRLRHTLAAGEEFRNTAHGRDLRYAGIMSAISKAALANESHYALPRPFPSPLSFSINVISAPSNITHKVGDCDAVSKSHGSPSQSKQSQPPDCHGGFSNWNYLPRSITHQKAAKAVSQYGGVVSQSPCQQRERTYLSLRGC